MSGQAKLSCGNKQLWKSQWFTTKKDYSVFTQGPLQIWMAFQDKCRYLVIRLLRSCGCIVFFKAFSMITVAGRESAAVSQVGSALLSLGSNFCPLARTSHRALPSSQKLRNAVFHVTRRVKKQTLASTCNFYSLPQWLLNCLKIICNSCMFFWREERDLSFHQIP